MNKESTHGNEHQLELEGEIELGKRSIPGSWGQIALLIIFGSFTDFPASHPWQFWFFGSLICLANLIRFYLGIRQASFYPHKRRLWNTLFNASISIPGLAWGITFLLAIREAGLVHYTTTIALLIGSGSTAALVTSVAPRWKLAFTYITLVIGFPLIGLITLMERQATGLALIFITYHGFLTFQLRIQSKTFWESLRNRQSTIAQRNSIQTVVDTIPGLVSWIGPDLLYRGVNKNYAANYDAPPEEFIGKELGHGNPDMEFLAAVKKFMNSSLDQSAQEIHLSIKGRPRWHLLVMRKDALAAAYLICIDIDDLKQAQLELEQQRVKSELTSKLASIGEITASVAHEIRNPLAAITSSAELLQKLIDSGTLNPVQLKTIAARMYDTAQRINKIIDTLRTFSRKTEGEPYQIVPLPKVIHESLDLVGEHFRTKHVALHLNQIDDSLQIRCRPVEISQVVVNLLNNALDAVVGKKDAWVQVTAEEEEDWVTLRIVDSGPGIPQDVRDHIFTPFFTTKPVGKGTGLGLGISREIIGRHGGALELDESSPHTTFTVRLPLAA